MKRSILLLLLGLVLGINGFAQEKLYIHKTDKITVGALIAKTDSIYFNNDGSIAYFRIGGSIAQFQVANIDSISFGNNLSTIYVNYDGTSATVINPLAYEGVSVSVNGADVTVNSSVADQEITCVLSGTTTNGMFKVYSAYKFNLSLNGVSIANPDGPAVNIQSGKKCTLNLEAGTINSLSDGASYATSSEDQKATLFSEGQIEIQGTGSLSVASISHHAICSDDHLIIQDGTITVSAAGKDGIHTNDYLKISGGTLNITASEDGMESEDGYILISGGNITTVSSAAGVKGITADSTLTVTGGTLNVTVGGDKSKGIKSGNKMILSGGSLTINTSGSAALVSSGSGYDPDYCTAIRCDSTVTLGGADITIKSTGKGGKGVSSDRNIIITSGSLTINTSGAGSTYKNSSGSTDTYGATCMTADGNILIEGGTVTLSSSGAGGRGITANGTLTIGDSNYSPTVNVTTTGATISTTDFESKAIKIDGAVTVNNGTTTISSADDGIKSKTSVTINGGNVTVTNSYEGIEAQYITVNGGNVSVMASNDGINATKSTTSGGTEQNDGSCVYMNGGYLVSSCSQGDAIDSNGNFSMKGGTMILHGPPSQPEQAIDVNGTLDVSGGFFIAGSTNSNMNKAMDSSSAQYGIYATTNSGISANSIFRIQDASGNDLVTFKPQRTAYVFLFSSPNLKSGTTYYVYTGGSCTGTLKDGLYTGGTYSGGTQKKSFTISSRVTKFSF